MLLLHFGPEAIEWEGLKTLHTLPPNSKEWGKYTARARKRGLTEREHLEMRRGPNALKSVSLLIEHPPVDARPEILHFCDKRVCYEVDYARLLADGLVLEAWVTIEHPAQQVDPALLEEILQVAEKDYQTHHHYVFGRIPHAIIAVVDGVIPPQYVRRIN
jgi:hypothetical protein